MSSSAVALVTAALALCGGGALNLRGSGGGASFGWTIAFGTALATVVVLRVELAYWSRMRAAMASSRFSAEVSNFLFAAVLSTFPRRVGKSGLRTVGGAGDRVSHVLSGTGSVLVFARARRLGASNSASVQSMGW